MSRISTTSQASDFTAIPGRPLVLVAMGLGLGVAVDVLFHGHRIGISFPIWAALGAVAILAACRIERIQPAPVTWPLVAAILFFATIPALRHEPLTVVLSLLATLLVFGLLVRTLLHGRLHRFGFLDLALTWLSVPLEAILRPWPTLGVATRQVTGDRVARSRLFAVMRGLLLAIPVLFVFVALLAAADLVFGDMVEEALAWLDVELIAEYLGRILVVLVSGIFFLGALVTALRVREARELIGEDKPIVEPFIGSIELTVVLGLVVVILVLFGAVQFRYMFGGAANIVAAGYTYSEYARRGFAELVWVAILSLGLIFVLGHWGKRAGNKHRWVFTGLSTVLVAMVGVALVSALMRLRLYESAFGFTRLRTYTHVFIYWLAVLLIAFLVLLYLSRLRAFAPLVVIAGLGFVATLSLMNVDGFIAARNLARFESSDDLDTAYLSQLSPDSLPVIATWIEKSRIAPPQELLAQVACESAILADSMAGGSWQSTHLGRVCASSAIASIAGDMRDYSVRSEGMSWYVTDPSGEEQICQGIWRD